MFFNALFSLILSIFGYSAHAQEADKLWFDTAEKMAAATSPEEMRQILDQEVPGFRKGIEKDACHHRDLVNLWGLSRNIDESHLTDGTRTVPANVIQFIDSLLNVTHDSNAVFGHAGAAHTYGYMLSNLSTPFGFKRLRYVAGELEAGFGLHDQTFAGLPYEGTLLSNLTNFVAPIAFRDHPEMLAKIHKSKVHELRHFDYSKLKVTRLVELIKNERFTLELRTDIVPFILPNNRGNNASLLIYSLDFHATGQNSQPRLITAFPVDKNFANGLFAPTGLGDQMAMKLKYNAALPVTIPADQMVGKRFIADDNIEHSSSRR